jgi:UDP-N-acetylglucosamine enolpyruvyl transferase
MASFKIEGGHKLKGDIIPQGAKNEALQVLCAVLLSPETITISNIPDILDVNNLIKLLNDMGVEVSRINADTYTFKAENIDLSYLETEDFYRQSASLRGSVMIVGPLVARFGTAMIPKPGGELTEIKIFRHFDYGTCRVTDLFMTDSYYNLKTNYEQLTQKQHTILLEDLLNGN